MFKPYPSAPIYAIMRNGKQFGGYIFNWKTAEKRAKNLCNDLFEHNQIEILNVETGQIYMIQKGMKCRQ